jgi:hypothetical protein
MFAHAERRLLEARQRVYVLIALYDGLPVRRPQRSPCTTPLGENIGEQPIDWQNCATGALDRSHWAIRSAQILAVFEDAQRDISRISLRTGIETRAFLESTHKRALR